MNTQISLPDATFEAAEQLASQLQISRSQLYAQALDRYVFEHGGLGVAGKLDEADEDEPDSPELDPVLIALQWQALHSPKQVRRRKSGPL